MLVRWLSLAMHTAFRVYSKYLTITPDKVVLEPIPETASLPFRSGLTATPQTLFGIGVAHRTELLGAYCTTCVSLHLLHHVG